VPRAEVLTIGDSIAHDVAGGAAMELDTALNMSGIHSRMFDPERGAAANRAALEQLAREYGVLPRWVLPRFAWRA
jgi:ribonucleotide monophosphatase NagD (HAD superfamily)